MNFELLRTTKLLRISVIHLLASRSGNLDDTNILFGVDIRIASQN